jgi:hypothetical protein
MPSAARPSWTHAADVEVSLALAIQVLLAEIAVPALKEDGEEAQLIFFAESGHIEWER